MVYNGNMRTTITMDEETAEIATQYARANGLSLSKAISELIQRSIRPKVRNQCTRNELRRETFPSEGSRLQRSG